MGWPELRVYSALIREGIYTVNGFYAQVHERREFGAMSYLRGMSSCLRMPQQIIRPKGWLPCLLIASL